MWIVHRRYSIVKSVIIATFVITLLNSFQKLQSKKEYSKNEMDRLNGIEMVKCMLSNHTNLAVKRRILIITTGRSGSSYLLHLLGSLPASYLYFEPLIALNTKDAALVEPDRSKAEDMVESLFHCQKYNRTLQMFEKSLNQPERESIFKQNERVWNICCQFPSAAQGDNGLCYDPLFLEEACHLFPIQVLTFLQ